ncbi:hypothetical protein PtB15_1B891 [Puccinia triticina]|nr:hypothetical protein PtB15_1B891 [Puccinia triticina]
MERNTSVPTVERVKAGEQMWGLMIANLPKMVTNTDFANRRDIALQILAAE